MRKGAQSATRRKRYFIIGAVVAALLIAAAIVAATFVKHSETETPGPIPENIQTQVDFPIYYPKSTASAWHVDSNSVQTENGVVLYIVTGTSGDISISQQPKPQNFDFEKFHKKILTGGTLLSVPAGNGAIGRAEGKLIGSVVTDKSWILLTPASPSITQEQILELSDSLKAK